MLLNRRTIPVVLLSLALLIPLTLHAGSRNPANYPLHVHIYNVHWHGSNYYGYRGFGRANLTDGSETHGMEYTFECQDHFMVSEPSENYLAKWKKPGQTVELLLGEIGSQKTHTCDLKVSLKDFVFVRHDGLLSTVTEDEYQRHTANLAERRADLNPEDRDSAHYPLRLTILNLNWGSTTGGIHNGMGQGNLDAPAGPSAVDFSIDCPVKIIVNPEGRFYRGQWQVQGQTMNLLLHQIGDSSQAAICHLKTIVHDDVYIRQSSGVLQAVSQSAYKQLNQANPPRAANP